VRVDPQLLHRVLVNLLSNALRHVAAAGCVRISAEAEPQRVCLRIANDGPEISSEDAPRIFDPFFTRHAQGTGLGLCIVKQLVERMGGRVELESRGSPVSFSVRLAT
jgi:signal transduction histidine kinase